MHNSTTSAILLLNVILKYIYTLFIGILLALFVGVGIAAFYKTPKFPEYPMSLKYTQPIPPAPNSPQASADAEKMRQDQISFDREQKVYQDASEKYQRNVSIIALIAAIIFLVISLTAIRKLLVITDGVLLGGVFTLVYSIVRGFQTTDTMFRFIVVSVGLVIALALGYIKFIKPAKR